MDQQGRRGPGGQQRNPGGPAPGSKRRSPQIRGAALEGRWRSRGAVAGREAEGRKAAVEGRRGQGRMGRGCATGCRDPSSKCRRGCAAGCRDPSSRRRPLLFRPYPQVSSLRFPPKLRRLQALFVAGLYFPRRRRFPLDFPPLARFPPATRSPARLPSFPPGASRMAPASSNWTPRRRLWTPRRRLRRKADAIRSRPRRSRRPGCQSRLVA